MKSKVEKKIAPTQKIHRKFKGSLWGLTTYFNPQSSPELIRDFRIFREHSKKQGLKLLAVEFHLDQRGPSLRKKIDADLVLTIRGQSKTNILFQRDQLLEIGLSHLPSECEKVVVLDSKAMIDDTSWIEDASLLLEQFDVIKPYEQIQLPPKVEIAPGAKILSSQDFQTTASNKIDCLRPSNHPITMSQSMVTAMPWVARRSKILKQGFSKISKTLLDQVEVVPNLKNVTLKLLTTDERQQKFSDTYFEILNHFQFNQKKHLRVGKNQLLEWTPAAKILGEATAEFIALNSSNSPSPYLKFLQFVIEKRKTQQIETLHLIAQKNKEILELKTKICRAKEQHKNLAQWIQQIANT